MGPIDVLAPIGLVAGLGSFVATMAARRGGRQATPDQSSADNANGEAPAEMSDEPPQVPPGSGRSFIV